MSETDVKNRAEQGRNLLHMYYDVYQFVLKLMKRKKYKSKAHRNRRIFVYTFCLINICLSLSDDANKIKTLNIERA